MPKHLSGLSKSWRKVPNRSGATLVCCTISGFFYCIHASFSSSSSSSSSWLQAASIFLESPKRHRCAAPPFLSSAKNGTHAGPTRFSQKWLGRLNKVQRSHQRESQYWWEHIAKPTSQVQVKAGDLCDPIYKASVSIHVGFAWLCLLLKPKQPRRLHIQFKCSSVDQPKALALVYCTLAGSWCLPSGTANVAAGTNTLIEITRQYGYIMLHWVLQLLSLKAHTHTTNACRDRISSESPQLRKAYPKCSAAQTLKSTVFLVDVNKRMIRLSHQSLKSPAVGIWIVPPTVAANKTLAGSLACEGKSVSLVKELESLRLTWQPNNTSPSVTLTTRTNNLGSSSSATVVCALVFSSQNQSFLRLYTEYFQNHQFKTQYLINNMNISKWFKIQRAPGVFVAPLNHRNRYGLISSHFRRWHRASQLWLTLLQACYHRSLPA